MDVVETPEETLNNFKEIDSSVDPDDIHPAKDIVKSPEVDKESKVNSAPDCDPSNDAALEIHDLDPDLFIVAEEEEEKVDKKPSVCEAIKKKMEIENKRQLTIWVTNVSQNTKASSLKKFISEHGKVSSVKILSKMKSYFGLVTMKSVEDAASCIKKLNGSVFEGKKIKLSYRQPELKETKQPNNEKDKSKSKEADKTKSKKTKDIDDKKEKSNKDSLIKKKDDIIFGLRKDLDYSKSEIERLRRRLSFAEERLKFSNNEIDKLNFQLRSERRKSNSDLEHAENRNKLKEIRLDADRALLNKELEEVQRLRDHLKSKIESVKSPKRHHYHRSSRSRDDRSLKRKWSASSASTLTQRHRSTPPPPKIFDSRKRSSEPENVFYKSPRRESSRGRNDKDRRNRGNLTAPIFVGSLVKAVGTMANRNTWTGSSDNDEGRRLGSQVSTWDRNATSARRNIWN